MADESLTPLNQALDHVLQKTDAGNVETLNGGAVGSLNFPSMPQVGGNPIVERGSNADGEWVRYADGTQICWNTSLIAPSASLITVTGGFALVVTWTFPVAFSSVDVTIQNSYQGTSGASPVGNEWHRITFSRATQSLTASAIAQWYEGTYAAGTDQELKAIAIGRWF